MKKSFDYFKMLKELSEDVNNTFLKCVNNESFEKDKIAFRGTKSELINNLQDEFITPLERGDIFILVQYLATEINSISIMQEYLPFFQSDCQLFADELKYLFDKQTAIFFDLSRQKDYKKLGCVCREGISSCDTIIFNLLRKIKSVVSLTSNGGALLKYSVYTSFLDVAKSLRNTFCEFERTLINNS